LQKRRKQPERYAQYALKFGLKSWGNTLTKEYNYG
jgi:hypothetical protein